MLSVVDLVEAGTLSDTQTAWLLSRILMGTSWLVGARPGGAGKTTVMSALLAMTPRNTRFRLTNSGSGWRECSAGDYVVSYELSPGFYDAYIWGEDVVRMTELGMADCRIVSNLHADTLEQAREQIVGECGATEGGFRAFQLFIPLVFRDGSRFHRIPVVEQIDYVREGHWRHWHREESPPPGDLIPRPFPSLERIAGFVDECRRRGLRLIEDVREQWLAWCDLNQGSI
jgi:hypothetical protein